MKLGQGNLYATFGETLGDARRQQTYQVHLLFSQMKYTMKIAECLRTPSMPAFRGRPRLVPTNDIVLIFRINSNFETHSST